MNANYRPNIPGNVRPLLLPARALSLWENEFAREALIYRLMFGDKQSTSSFWEIGDRDGVYYLSSIEPGLRADVNICMFTRNRKFLGKNAYQQHRIMAAYLMDAYALHRLGFQVVPTNTASIRLCDALNVVWEGTLRSHGVYNDEIVDVRVGSLIRKDL